MKANAYTLELRKAVIATAVWLVASGCAKHEPSATSAPLRGLAANPGGVTAAASDTAVRSPALAATPTAAAASAPQVEPATASRILAEVRASRAPVTVVNVWATWCAPCREEFPELARFARDWRGRGVRVLLVSADFEDQLPQVRAFLAAHGVTDRSWIKTGDDMQFINGLNAKWSGALPATFVYDDRGTLRQFWEGMADYARFESETRAILGQRKERS